MDYAADELIDTSIAEVDEAAVEFGFTQRLTMVGLGASTATATVVVAENTGSLGTGRYSVSQVDLINDGTGYTIAPLVGIATAPSGGTNATAVAIMTSRTGQTGQSIDSIQLTNPGYGYSVPPVITIRSQNAFGTGGIATAIISQGSLTIPTINDPGAEYGTTPTVLIGVAPVGGTNAASVAIVNTAGGISQIRYTNAGAGYTVVPNVIIDAPASGINTGNYLFREMVKGVSTGTTAYVESWDSDDRILKINNISGSGFAIGEAVVGIGTSNNGSDAKYIVQSTSDQDEYDLYNENILVESEADAILDFTEDNPFGDF